MFFESSRNVYGDSGRGALFSRDVEDSVCLDSGDFCPWNREMLICSCANAPVIVRQSMKMINDIFFIIICFYDGTLKGNEKLQVFVFFLEKMRHRVTFLLGKENWSSNGYSVRIADRKK